MASFNRLRLITFDVTNTLLQFRSSPGKQYGEIGALFGVLCDNNDLAKNFKINWRKMNRTYPNFGRSCNMGWNEWWQLLIAGIFNDSGARIPDDKLKSFTHHLVNLYKTSICWQHCNGSLDLLNYLRVQQQLAATQQSNETSKEAFVLGVIANFDPRLDALLRNMKINNYFHFSLNSYDSRAEKPDKAIFDMAIKSAKLEHLKPEECLHVGDGPTTDYLAAKDLGWNAALIHEKQAHYLINKYGEKIREDFVFPSLFDFHKKLSSNVIKW